MDNLKEVDRAALARVRTTAESPPRVSVYDVIEAITSQDGNQAGLSFRRLAERFPEVQSICVNFKFPGQGQRPTPVADARGITEVIMLLPGRAAAHFRKTCADVVVRYLGGDPRIVEEVAAIRLAQEHNLENHPMRIFGETVECESEELRKKREAVQLAELELQLADIRGRAKKARVESVTESVESGLNCMRNLGLPIDDRARARAADMIQQAVFEEAHDAPGDPEICVRHFLQSKGIRDPSMDSRLGKLAKQLLLKDKPTHVFQKKSIFCNGQMIQANVWHESERGYLEQAFAALRPARQ